MRFQILFLSLLLLPLAVVGRKELMVGAWQPVKDIHNPHLKEIGEFAVNQYNKETNAKLIFEGLIKAETQVVSGINYRLTVTARDAASGGTVQAVNDYETVVWEKGQVKKLESFKKLLKLL